MELPLQAHGHGNLDENQHDHGIMEIQWTWLKAGAKLDVSPHGHVITTSFV